MMKLTNKLSGFIACLILGAALGAIAKYLDTVAVDGSWWTNILHYFADLLTRLGIWVWIAAMIAAYSKTLIRSAINTFLFFLGMLISYYVYSAYLFGFFPTSYFVFWGSIALVSPILGMIVWQAKHHARLAFILPALPMGLLLSLSLGMGLFYVYLSYIEELVMYVVLCAVFYRELKQMAISVVFSFAVAFIVEQINPLHF